jgi:rhamnose transport system ATP-binding protein
VDPDTPVIELSVAQRHLVQIARSLSMDARLVIMDEPTSALSLRETEDLFRIIRQLKAEGKAILFISHKFDEIFAICDSYTVLRDGKYIGSGLVKDITLDALVQMMAGRPLTQMFPKHHASIGVPVLEVEGFSQGSSFREVSFTLHSGEILGMFGLVGAGRSEVIRALIGVDRRDAGTVKLHGKSVEIRNPRDALERGIACVPEDRQGQGLVLQMSISHNITLPQVAALGKAGFRSDKAEAALTEEYGRKMEIRAAGWNAEAGTLSGGNQQKVVLAKWLATQPSILILDEPTKGIDVGTKAAVHEFISRLAEKGMSIIMISSELPEILGMSDRILVMHEGRLAATFDRAEATEEKVIMAAMGNAKSDFHREETGNAKSDFHREETGNAKSASGTKKTGGRR